MIDQAMLLIPLLLAVAVLVTFGLLVKSAIGRLADRISARRDGRGVLVPLSRSAKIMPGLPIDIALIAGRSAGAVARQSLNFTILRPTLGLRVISIGLSVLLLVIVWLPPDPALQMGPAAACGITAMVAYAFFNTAFYEARYDADILEAPNRAFQRKEHRWSDLKSIQDNGHYLYVLRFETGAKVEMPKHLAGIRDFLTIVQMYAEANRRL